MQNIVKGRAAELARAKRSLAGLARRVQTVELAARTGIHQSQVSRLLRGQFRRISPNVRKLLAYQPGAKAAAPDGQSKKAVIQAALKTWDETPEGAQALVRLLRSVEALRSVKADSRKP
jgi:transcriptional regulator with XRE-family HTH domain